VTAKTATGNGHLQPDIERNNRVLESRSSPNDHFCSASKIVTDCCDTVSFGVIVSCRVCCAAQAFIVGRRARATNWTLSVDTGVKSASTLPTLVMLPRRIVRPAARQQALKHDPQIHYASRPGRIRLSTQGWAVSSFSSLKHRHSKCIPCSVIVRPW